MEEMIPVEPNNLPEQADQKVVPVPAEGRRLYITRNSEGFDFRALLGQAVQCLNMADIIAQIKAGTQYVIQIPAQFQEAYESGEMFIMENMKTGKKWPSLMQIMENGKHQVVTPLPIAEQAIFQGNPIQELANSHHNMLMQQQVAHLADMLQDTYKVVKQIKQGQMDDRVGFLKAGRNGLVIAMSLPEGDERNGQIEFSRQNLFVGQAQIAEALKRSVEAFQPVSKYALIRFAKEMGHSGYLAEKRREVLEMQDIYDQYLTATKLLAASYVMTGSIDAAKNTFQTSESAILEIDFSKVKTIGYQHKGLTDMFYTAPAGYIAAELDDCLKEAKQYDYVALEVSGEELLEVLESGQEAVQEAGTEE